MVDTRLASARKAWTALRGVLVQKGWRDRTTALLLFDTFVKTCLLYGVPVWGSHVLPKSGEVAADCTGQVGAFYRGALCLIMGLGRAVRDGVVFILAGRLPICLYIAKAMWRYERSLSEGRRLASKVAKWAWGLEGGTRTQRLTVLELEKLCIRYGSPTSMYRESMGLMLQ